MRRETAITGVATLGTVVGSAVLLLGTADHGNRALQIGGGLVVVLSIVVLAAYLAALDEPPGAGH